MNESHLVSALLTLTTLFGTSYNVKNVEFRQLDKKYVETFELLLQLQCKSKIRSKEEL